MRYLTHHIKATESFPHRAEKNVLCRIINSELFYSANKRKLKAEYLEEKTHRMRYLKKSLKDTESRPHGAEKNVLCRIINSELFYSANKRKLKAECLEE